MLGNQELFSSLDSNQGETPLEIDQVELETLLTGNWLEGVDAFKIKSLSANFKVFQVLNCLDVTVPKQKLEDLYDEEENKGEEDTSWRPNRGSKSNRMLKVSLFDGDSNFLAYEYEPIGAFDTFFDSSTNSMSRCCVKIALYNSPVIRRNCFWLTNSNVKLLFDGYSCKKFCGKVASQETTQPDGAVPRSKYARQDMSQSTYQDMSMSQSTYKQSQLEVTPEVMEIASNLFHKDHSEPLRPPQPRDFMTSAPPHPPHRPSSSFPQPWREETPSQSPSFENVTSLKDYFPPESNYIQHSFLSFLKRLDLPFNNQSFLKFSKERFTDSYTELEINLTNFSNFLNFNSNLEDFTVSSSPTDPYSLYKFGFLNHSSPYLVDQMSPFYQILSLIVEKIFVSSKKKIWFAIFDDCTLSTFCIFDLDLFSSISPFMEELTISLELNALEGFFLLEDLDIEGNKIRVIRDFLTNLPYDVVREKAKQINEEYAKIEHDFIF